jgi:hypothetical protein
VTFQGQAGSREGQEEGYTFIKGKDCRKLRLATHAAHNMIPMMAIHNLWISLQKYDRFH